MSGRWDRSSRSFSAARGPQGREHGRALDRPPGALAPQAGAMTFSTVLFDLFDTLVLFDRNRLPEVQIDGRSVRSTAGHLFPILAPHAPGVDLVRFFAALIWSWQEAERV